LIAASWLTTNADTDVNGDGIVNGQDIAIASANWLQTTDDGASGAAVPEPSSVILAAVGGLAILATRPRLAKRAVRRRAD
jgi:hypothetical protein